MNTNVNAKRILCFGDSFTWGYIPDSGHLRFAPDKRWPGALQNLLKSDYEIIEEGLNSRTLTSEDLRPNKEGRNGSVYLIPCLDTHDPLDLVILMLGTNELKEVYNLSPKEVADLLEQRFVTTILKRKSQFKDTCPKLLVIAPPVVNETTDYAKDRYKGATAKSKDYVKELKIVADTNNCMFLDSNEFVKVGDDGVHFDEQCHLNLAKGIFSLIKNKSEAETVSF